MFLPGFGFNHLYSQLILQKCSPLRLEFTMNFVGRWDWWTYFHLTTVTYGIRAALNLTIRTLLQLVKDEGENYPLAVDSLLYGRYVDDIFGGAESNEILIEKAKQLISFCTAGDFPRNFSQSHQLKKLYFWMIAILTLSERSRSFARKNSILKWICRSTRKLLQNGLYSRKSLNFTIASESSHR